MEVEQKVYKGDFFVNYYMDLYWYELFIQHSGAKSKLKYKWKVCL